MNIYEKVLKVMESIEYLKKDDVVGTGTSAYKAISDEKVKVNIRNAMIYNKLVMFRTNIETEVISREYEQYNKYSKANENKIQHFTKVKSTYKIVNAENPKEFLEIQSIGHGVDPQDKSAGKAMTYASKYALLDTFLIPTGEDSDKTHSNDIEQPVNDANILDVAKIATLDEIAKKNNYSQADVNSIIKKKYNLDNTKLLSVEQWKEMCDGMKAKPKTKGDK